MKRNTSNWSNFCMLLRRAGFTASAGLLVISDISDNTVLLLVNTVISRVALDVVALLLLLLLIFTAFLWHLLQFHFQLHFIRWASLSCYWSMQALVKGCDCKSSIMKLFTCLLTDVWDYNFNCDHFVLMLASFQTDRQWISRLDTSCWQVNQTTCLKQVKQTIRGTCRMHLELTPMLRSFHSPKKLL